MATNQKPEEKKDETAPKGKKKVFVGVNPVVYKGIRYEAGEEVEISTADYNAIGKEYFQDKPLTKKQKDEAL